MTVLKNFGLMGTSTLVRMVFGFLTFLVMARLLGPEAFGLVMLWMSVATLACLVANFGLTPYLLREIGSNPETVRKTMSDVLTAKLLLSALVASCGIISLPWLHDDSRLIFPALLAALLADSMTEFLNVGFRSTNRFADETRLALVGTLCQFLLVVLPTWIWPSAAVAALAFTFSRFFVLGITWIAQAAHLSGLRPSPINAGMRRIRETRLFAADFSLQSIFGQVDSLVVHQIGGAAAVGVYQIGMRMFLAGMQIASVLGNVFIPYLANERTELRSSNRQQGYRLLVASFFLAGIMGAVIFSFMPEETVRMMFGNEYSNLISLLPMFGLLFFVRNIASAYGIQLTVGGRQKVRAVSTAAHWLIVFGLVWLLGAQSMWHWLFYLVIGSTSLAIIYFLSCRYTRC